MAPERHIQALAQRSQARREDATTDPGRRGYSRPPTLERCSCGASSPSPGGNTTSDTSEPVFQTKLTEHVFVGKLFQIQKCWRPPWRGSSCWVWRNVQSRSTAPGSGSWGWRNILLQCCYWEKTLQRTTGQYAAALPPPQHISTRSQIQVNTPMHANQVITVETREKREKLQVFLLLYGRRRGKKTPSRR